MLKRFVLGCAMAATAACATGPYSARSFAGSLDFLYDNVAPIGFTKIKGDSHAHYWTPLVNEAMAHGVMVLVVDLPEGTMGRYSPSRQVILVNKALEPNARVATLLHEIGHVLEPVGLSMFEGDVFAETVSVVTAKRLGLDITMHSAGYFLADAPSSGAAVVRRLAPYINIAVEHLVAELDVK
jgi:hypothetical protein